MIGELEEQQDSYVKNPRSSFPEFLPLSKRSSKMVIRLKYWRSSSGSDAMGFGIGKRSSSRTGIPLVGTWCRGRDSPWEGSNLFIRMNCALHDFGILKGSLSMTRTAPVEGLDATITIGRQSSVLSYTKTYFVLLRAVECNKPWRYYVIESSFGCPLFRSFSELLSSALERLFEQKRSAPIYLLHYFITLVCLPFPISAYSLHWEL